MKLELFDFIDDTMELIEEKSEELNRVALELEKFFNDSFFIKDHFLNVNYRIKSAESLREKILRYNFYMVYETPEKLVHNLSDLIGFRIECRFIADERKIYRDMVKLFDIKEENGYYSNPLNSAIMLNLEQKQPMIQKNGFEIYKIDGKYKKDDVEVNFELQIKSLVNVFWGEIDHRILYKNFNYMLTEDFFKDIMSSINDNLAMIDRQLMVVFNHLDEMDASVSTSKEMQIKSLLSKIIHDTYITKVRQEINFVVDFKKSTDVIVDFIFSKGGNEESYNYSENFLRILNRLNEIGKRDLNFDSYIDFEDEISFTDDFSESIGRRILQVINKDFRWNLFFKIIFEIENTSKKEDFEDFIVYLRDKVYDKLKEGLSYTGLDGRDKERIIVKLMRQVANNFNKEVNIDYLNACSFDRLMYYTRGLFAPVKSCEDWEENKDQIIWGILNFKI